MNYVRKNKLEKQIVYFVQFKSPKVFVDMKVNIANSCKSLIRDLKSAVNLIKLNCFRVLNNCENHF